MKKLVLLAVIPALLIGVVGFNGTAEAQQGGRQEQGAVALGGLFNSLVNLQNVEAQANLENVLNNLLQGSDIRVVNLNNVLNGSQINVLSDILNHSSVLSDITVTVQNILNNSLNNNTVLQDFLNDNNVAINRVISVDVLSGGGLTLFTFEPR